MEPTRKDSSSQNIKNSQFNHDCACLPQQQANFLDSLSNQYTFQKPSSERAQPVAQRLHSNNEGMHHNREKIHLKKQPQEDYFAEYPDLSMEENNQKQKFPEEAVKQQIQMDGSIVRKNLLKHINKNFIKIMEKISDETLMAMFMKFRDEERKFIEERKNQKDHRLAYQVHQQQFPSKAKNLNDGQMMRNFNITNCLMEIQRLKDKMDVFRGPSPDQQH